MSAGAATELLLPEPLHLELSDGAILAGLWLRGEGRLTVLFLHDEGADLDSVMPAMAGLGLPEVNKLAVDLPGHGLSTDADELRTLTVLCDRLQAEGQGPLVIVGCGTSATLAWALATRSDVMGLAFVSPVVDSTTLPETIVRVPVIAIVAEPSPTVVISWQALKTKLRARWMSVSMHVPHEDLAKCADSCRRQTASHLNGFIRSLLVG